MTEGDIQSASSMLGRPYRLVGTVVRGRGEGRGLRSPTANLDLPAMKLMPADGVYFVRALSMAEHPGLLYVGTRPTMGGGPRGAEVHLMDFDGELYGTPLELSVLARLRGDVAFGSREELAAQIKTDIERARGLASGQGS